MLRSANPERSDEAESPEHFCVHISFNCSIDSKAMNIDNNLKLVTPVCISHPPCSQNRGGDIISLYIRLYDGSKISWFRINTSNQDAFDKDMTNITTSLLENGDQDRNFPIMALENSVFILVNGINGFLLDKKGGGFSPLPAMNFHWPNAKLAYLNGAIYVIRALEIPPLKFFHVWGEVLKPQSTEWELLSSPSPVFSLTSRVFVHAADDLDMLVLGSFVDNCLYLYDPKTEKLEKVDNFLPGLPMSGNTTVVGNYLVWCSCHIFCSYDLVQRKLYDEQIEGGDILYKYVVQSYGYPFHELMYMGGGTFCLIFFERDTSVIQLFEFAVCGTCIPFHPRLTFSYKCSSIGRANCILDVMLMRERSDETDPSEHTQDTCIRQMLNICLPVNYPKPCTNLSFALLSSFLPSSSEEGRQEREEVCSFYVRMDDMILEKPLWYCFNLLGDGLYKNKTAKLLDKADLHWGTLVAGKDSRIYLFRGRGVYVVETKWGFGYHLPSRNYDWSSPKVLCMNGCIYVIGRLRCLPYDNIHLEFNHGWGEVFKPGSTKWELLSSPSPDFKRDSDVFIHSIDVLDKLVFGSFKENFLYIYDPETATLERVDDFSPGSSMSGYTIVIGIDIIWCSGCTLYMYNLVDRKSYHKHILGVSDQFVSEVSRNKRHVLIDLGSGSVGLVFLETDTDIDHLSFLTLFVIDIGIFRGNPVSCLTYYKKFPIRWSCGIMDILPVS